MMEQRLGAFRKEASTKASTSMQRVTGLFKGNYAEHEDPDNEDSDIWSISDPEARGKTSQSGAPAPVHQRANDPWHQVDNVKAQLETELKRERPLTKDLWDAPQDKHDWSPPQAAAPWDGRSRAESMNSPLEQNLSAPGSGAETRERSENRRARRKTRDRMSSNEGESLRGSEVPSGGTPWGMSVATPWQPASPALQAATVAERGGAKVSLLGEAASNALIHAQDYSTIDRSRASSEVETHDNVLSVAPSDARQSAVATQRSPRVDPKPLAREQTVQPSVQHAPGQFDEAILAALAALPQQSLVDVLRRLSKRRPSEVALAFQPIPQDPNPSDAFGAVSPSANSNTPSISPTSAVGVGPPSRPSSAVGVPNVATQVVPPRAASPLHMSTNNGSIGSGPLLAAAVDGEQQTIANLIDLDIDKAPPFDGAPSVGAQAGNDASERPSEVRLNTANVAWPARTEKTSSPGISPATVAAAPASVSSSSGHNLISDAVWSAAGAAGSNPVSPAIAAAAPIASAPPDIWPSPNGTSAPTATPSNSNWGASTAAAGFSGSDWPNTGEMGNGWPAASGWPNAPSGAQLAALSALQQRSPAAPATGCPAAAPASGGAAWPDSVGSPAMSPATTIAAPMSSPADSAPNGKSSPWPEWPPQASGAPAAWP